MTSISRWHSQREAFQPAADGVPAQGLPAHVERHSEVVLRDFNPEQIGEEPAAPTQDA